MMKKGFGAAASLVLLLCAVFTLEYGRAQEGSPLRGLRVKVHYKGSRATRTASARFVAGDV